jgi:hypothetical protein
MGVFSCWSGLLGQPAPKAESGFSPLSPSSSSGSFGSEWNDPNDPEPIFSSGLPSGGKAGAAEEEEGPLPEELVERILTYVPPIDQVTKYQVATPGPKWFEADFVGHYTVTFRGSVKVGGKADVHVVISDERTDGRCPFPTFQYAWGTEVIAVGPEGVTLARGAEKGGVNSTVHTIKKKVVRGRLIQ